MVVVVVYRNSYNGRVVYKYMYIALMPLKE